MHLPRTIHVSGYTVKIKYKNKLVADGVECFGYYDTQTKTIYLQKGLPPQSKKEYFLHEFLHFLEDIYRFRIKEQAVADTALGLLELFKYTNIDFRSDD